MNYYDGFVRNGHNVGFTDDQIEFLWDWLLQVAEDPQALLSPDNYIREETNH